VPETDKANPIFDRLLAAAGASGADPQVTGVSQETLKDIGKIF
jgi:hypothetical protein